MPVRATTSESKDFLIIMIQYHKNKSLENLFYINEFGLICQEEFRDIPTYVGMYKASDLGRVMSLRRTIPLIMSQSLVKDGYLSVGLSVKGKLKTYSTHQLIAMAFLGHVPCGYEIIVDHKVEGDRFNNTLPNLQLITPRGNTSKSIKNSTSKYTGVSWDTTVGKWKARIVQHKKTFYLGCYEDETDASKAYNDALEKVNKGEELSQYINPTKTSKYKGVNWDKDRGKWLVRFRRKNIGRFDDEDVAHLTYQKALKEYNENK